MKDENAPEEAGILHLDISKAVNKLGWYPVLDFRQTIKLAIEEYKVDGISSDEIFNQRIEHIDEYIELRRKIVYEV